MLFTRRNKMQFTDTFVNILCEVYGSLLGHINHLGTGEAEDNINSFFLVQSWDCRILEKQCFR